ncbi:VUT family protein [Sodalis sp. RH24]|uniref:VUT family protein n=1 Tax=unclassified Sodalis (in: enterobacteria) TaxID=2636512 RepID=UPI0039659C49
MNTDYKLYGLFVGLTVTIMVMCDTLMFKVFNLGDFRITASGIIFSLFYLLSTISTEVYGYKLGGRTVWIVVLCQTIYVFLINICAVIQVDSNAYSQHYYGLYNDFWRVTVATWVSMPASYFCNSFLISKLKVYFNGRFFIIRYTLSAMMAQAVLLITDYPISLSSKYSFYELVNIISTTWCYKVVMSIILLPVGIYIVHKIKKIEKTDYYDWGISYNPLTVFKGTNDDVKRNKFDDKG